MGYCTSKAALNMLAKGLAAEEETIVSLSIRPGVVDTPMQTLIRQDRHREQMGDAQLKFIDLKAKGKLVKPEDVSKVLGRILLLPEKARPLSGQFLSWDDSIFESF